MSATTARSAVPRRRRRSTSTAPIAAASIRQPISRTSRGFYRPMHIAGSPHCSEPRKAGPGLPMMPAITEVACWAHCRRSIFDVWQSTKSTVAKAVLDRIAQFYAIEDKARFAAPDERLAHRTDIIPLLDAFFTWAQTAERKLSARSELAQALRYIIKPKSGSWMIARWRRIGGNCRDGDRNDEFGGSPGGEQPEVEAWAAVADTYAGRVHVEWDATAPVTPFGQLPFFIEYLKQGGLFDGWVADCPLSLSSPNAPSKRDLLGTVLLSVLAGHRRYAHITALRCD